MTQWMEICPLNAIPVQGARIVKRDNEDDIAIFRTIDDQVFALHDRCPHKGGPLSQGIVSGQTVTCPLHNWQIDLATGQACAPDEGCAGHLAAKLEAGRVFLAMD